MTPQSISPLFVAQLPLGDDGSRKIRRVLIANRGEIACRIISTCKKLNVTSIAIYVQEDSLSRHVSMADESINLGSLHHEQGNPFLNVQRLVKVAKDANADAIHPGYGYLSENAAFADAVKQAGIIFIGPSSSAMSTLGDKRTAKDYLRNNDPSIPLIPGFAGSSQDPSELEHAAERIGFPIMLKASAGGGGKGMRIVRERSDLQAGLNSARSEATRSFGSGDCILEKYIEAGKHIEIQILGDSHGNVISLHERECSIQRRHQKVIEESPSPWMTPAKRKEMSDTAVRIGKLLGYENAGTVEFVVDALSGNFYFLEVNTRLQVEHPITEEVTRLDVVSLQLYVASGGNLSELPVLNSIPQLGHAIECRLCAEDPQRDFFPQHGIVRLWKQADCLAPEAGSVRFETAIRTGAQVSIHFDSMIAKIVVWAPNRSIAIDKMVQVLANTACIGLRTNQQFLQSCLMHPNFKDPSYTTSFVLQNLESLLVNPHIKQTPDLARALSIVACLYIRKASSETTGKAQVRPFRNVRTAFRNQVFDTVNVQADIVLSNIVHADHSPLMCSWAYPTSGEAGSYRVTVSSVPESSPTLDSDGKPSAAVQVAAQYNAISNAARAVGGRPGETYTTKLSSVKAERIGPPNGTPWSCADVVATVNEASLRASIVTIGGREMARSSMQKAEALSVMCHFPLLGDWIDFSIYDVLSFCESLRHTVDAALSDATTTAIAPMPCKVISLLKKDGDMTKAGEPLIVVESMKMEMNISISTAGKFSSKVNVGDAVDEGTVLCVVE